MIREFWVENYYSIKERQTISFEAKGSPDCFASVSVDGKTFLNKLAVLYGPNASGKSNLLLALETVFSLLTVSWNDRNKSIVSYRPFALMKGLPTKMFVSFYADGIRYDYEVAYDERFILKESLYYYPKGSKSLFYKRDFVSEDSAASISFGLSLNLKKRAETTFLSNTLNNHTVLSAYGKTSFEDPVDPVAFLYNWVMTFVHRVNEDGRNVSFADMMKGVCEDEGKKAFYLKMLQKADFNITDFHYVESDLVANERSKSMVLENTNLPEELKKHLLQWKQKDVFFTNKAGNETFELASKDQSSGTLRFLQRLSLLSDLMSGGHVFFMDEPEADLHHDLMLFYLNAFLFNTSNSQIIIASHLTSLLAEDLLNEKRDLVFFVEKDVNTAATKITRGDRYGLHKHQSLYNAYKIGRLGAKPELGSPFVL